MDEEMHLIFKESEKYEEIKQKVMLKNTMLKFKKIGYKILDKPRQDLVCIFLGYIHGISFEEKEEVLERISLAILEKREKEPICYILENKIKDKAEILKVLSE